MSGTARVSSWDYAPASSEPFLLLKENRFAYTALEHLSRNPYHAAARLAFIFGPAGVGKSHLLRQFVRQQLQIDAELQIAQVLASEFAAELAEASQHKHVHRFQTRYRHVDILICEDLGALRGRIETQQQLLFAIDEVLARGGRIVLTARRSPGELHGFLPKLTNRCHAGICAAVFRPDDNSRRLLLDQFARTQQIALSRNAAEHLTHGLPETPRELLAALRQLDELARRRQTQIDTRLVRDFLEGTPRLRVPTITEVARAVAQHFSVSLRELRGHSRKQHILFPRQCAVYLARELTQKPLGTLARYFGRRHHSSISHACRCLKSRLSRDPAAAQHVVRLHEVLRRWSNPDSE